MKWHDAKKEWPEEGKRVVIIPKDDNNNACGYSFEGVIACENWGDYESDQVKYWIYIDDIPKPE